MPARRWSCRQTNKNPQNKQAIADMKWRQPEEWKAIARAARIRDPNEPPSMPGVKDLVSQNCMILGSVKEIYKTTTLTDSVELDCKDEKSYAAHMKTYAAMRASTWKAGSGAEQEVVPGAAGQPERPATSASHP